ncbi:MAG: inorganic phosphate transporter [Bacilli bacterium]|jgi:PiT family inorganic phosphate transporter|nr:inorganic phosphate transporter [Bacilli bacterium]MCH4210556.1 inorganic phosphate transporter [Bacilli bacterium]MCH4228801.1 inorganic phosphate transporter [Bacilli bacterium]MCH4277402.1 inorganic phosphate transporter [Bacilli bacterium]
MSIGEFFSLLNAHPWGYSVLLLNFVVIFINGWTDGPNSIATCVTTKCVTPKVGVFIAAIFNLIGVLLIGLLGSFLSDFGSVAETIASLVNFDVSTEGALTDSLIALSAGLLAIIIWSLGSTYFGFPSSESNELVGGITGAGMALAALSGLNWFSSINWSSWNKVLIGFFGSLVLGFVLGYGITKLIELICRKLKRGETTRFFTKGQIASAAGMSLVHGIQDGAKFMGVFMLLGSMLSGESSGEVISSLSTAWWIYIPVAIVMTAGTFMGGYSIIKTLGSQMTKLEKYQAFATDVASVIGLTLATVFGLPVSTGTVKSTSILGGGSTKSLRKVHWDVAGKMIGSWILIFPLTAIIGFLVTVIFASIF